MIDRLKNLQANKGQFTNGGELFKACKSNYELRHEIEVLSNYYLQRKVSGCQNCYMDTYIELINLNIEKVMNKKNCDFKLRNGALLRDVVNQDISLSCTNLNITNELALYHLKTNPSCRKFFDALPEDVESLIKSFKIPGKGKELTEEEKADLARKEEEQAVAEKIFVSQVSELLKAGTTKKDIKAKMSEVEKIGHKKLTGKLLDELIKKAGELLQTDGETEKDGEGPGIDDENLKGSEDDTKE